MTPFVVLKDAEGDTHAGQIYGEASRQTIERTARDLSESLGLQDDIHPTSVAVGLVMAPDAGAARLMPVSLDGGGDGGVIWHGWLRPSGAYEQD